MSELSNYQTLITELSIFSQKLYLQSHMFNITKSYIKNIHPTFLILSLIITGCITENVTEKNNLKKLINYKYK